MNIAIAASEVAPYAKTGGLADVVGALPKALAKLGCHVKVFMPKYSSIDEAKYDLHYEYGVGEMPIRVSGVPWSVHVQRSRMPDSEVDLYLIDCPHFFHRNAIYTNDPDEHERFILFSKAVIEALQYLQWAPDVVHCNDWQTALIPLMAKDNYGWDRLFFKTGFLLTIHNIGYQGLFPLSALSAAEIRPELFYPGGAVEKDGAVCFLKAGILFAEIINTVSDTYAKEILTPQFGAGMEPILRLRESDVHGVLNGIDVKEWDPETDRHLPFHFSSADTSGKSRNKQFLFEKIGMPYRPDVPLIGIVSRLVAQKGLDLIADSLNNLMAIDAQWVILGTGEDRYEQMFTSIHRALPEKVWAYIGFNNELAHLIEAAADIFLMPSHYEPCGLNQMYSLRYGTVPAVRKTGGLADTVWDWDELRAAGSDEGNGFSFNDPTPFALTSTLQRAVAAFHNKTVWSRIQANGMKRDFSWNASARKYMELYRNTVIKRRTSGA
jgi:starch synthase